jgi:hypothetical protein
MNQLEISPQRYPRIRFLVPESRFNLLDDRSQSDYIIRARVTPKIKTNGQTN